jgi:hypothetical protein
MFVPFNPVAFLWWEHCTLNNRIIVSSTKRRFSYFFLDFQLIWRQHSVTIKFSYQTVFKHIHLWVQKFIIDLHEMVKRETNQIYKTYFCNCYQKLFLHERMFRKNLITSGRVTHLFFFFTNLNRIACLHSIAF